LVIICPLSLAAADAAGLLYLVKFKAGEAGAPTTKEQAIALLDGLIVPSLTQLSQDERVVAGGIFPGAREGAFVIRAASHEAVTKMVRALPAWGVWEWQVLPLESFAHRSKLEAEVVKGLKAP
jgi:hypothetical protein